MPSVCAVALNRDCPTPEIPREKTFLDKTQAPLSAITFGSGLASKCDCTTPDSTERKTLSDNTQHQRADNFKHAPSGNLDAVKTPEMKMHAIVLSPHTSQSAEIPALTRGILHYL